jgi:hypothetical protein
VVAELRLRGYGLMLAGTWAQFGRWAVRVMVSQRFGLDTPDLAACCADSFVK